LEYNGLIIDEMKQMDGLLIFWIIAERNQLFSRMLKSSI